MYKRIALSATAATSVGLTAIPAAPASASPVVAGPDGVKIAIVTTNGTGCTRDNTRAVLRDDNDGFSLDYADYTVRAGGDSKPIEARKSCQINLRITVPQDFTYGVSQVDYRLLPNLQSGAQGALKAGYYFHGGPQPETRTFTLYGPFNRSAQFNDQVSPNQLVWKPCGEDRPINITTELRVEPGTTDPSKVSTLSLNKADGNWQSYKFSWRRCP